MKNKFQIISKQSYDKLITQSSNQNEVFNFFKLNEINMMGESRSISESLLFDFEFLYLKLESSVNNEIVVAVIYLSTDKIIFLNKWKDIILSEIPNKSINLYINNWNVSKTGAINPKYLLYHYLAGEGFYSKSLIKLSLSADYCKLKRNEYRLLANRLNSGNLDIEKVVSFFKLNQQCNPVFVKPGSYLISDGLTETSTSLRIIPSQQYNSYLDLTICYDDKLDIFKSDSYLSNLDTLYLLILKYKFINQ